MVHIQAQQQARRCLSVTVQVELVGESARHVAPRGAVGLADARIAQPHIAPDLLICACPFKAVSLDAVCIQILEPSAASLAYLLITHAGRTLSEREDD